MEQNQSNQSFADQVANSVLKALQGLPGQTYLGQTVVKHRIAKAASQDELRRKCREMVESSWSKKYSNL